MRHLLSAAMGNPPRSTGEGCNDGKTNQASPEAAEMLAVDASADDWKSTVHALNVLRVVFVDATLADDVGPYVTEVSAPCLVDGSQEFMIYCSSIIGKFEFVAVFDP